MLIQLKAVNDAPLRKPIKQLTLVSLQGALSSLFQGSAPMDLTENLHCPVK